MTKKKESVKSKEQRARSVDKSKVAELEVQIAELNDSLLRERADAMNVRKRAEDEKAKLGGFYKALVVKDLLPVIDNFDRAMSLMQHKDESESKNHKDLQKGMMTIYKQFEQALTKLGVEKIRTVGEPFDPELHEAVTMEEGDGSSPAGEEIVSEEMQSGYRLDNEILRHAMVRVRG